MSATPYAYGSVYGVAYGTKMETTFQVRTGDIYYIIN